MKVFFCTIRSLFYLYCYAMNSADFIGLVQDIVWQAKAFKDTLITEESPVNYACIFCKDDEEYKTLISCADTLWSLLQETPSWPLYHISKIDTVAGPLQLLKVRKPDSTKWERWDADFTLRNYQEVKQRYLGTPWCNLIQRKDFEMLEFIKPQSDVRVYFSYPPLDQQFNIIS